MTGLSQVASLGLWYTSVNFWEIRQLYRSVNFWEIDLKGDPAHGFELDFGELLLLGLLPSQLILSECTYEAYVNLLWTPPNLASVGTLRAQIPTLSQVASLVSWYTSVNFWEIRQILGSVNFWEIDLQGDPAHGFELDFGELLPPPPLPSLPP